MSDPALKIALVLDDSLDKPDGVQQYVLSLGDWLSAQGHEVHYVVGETKRVDRPRIHSLARNIAVRFNGNRMSMPLPQHVKRIKQLLREENFDILHVQVPYSPFMAGKLIRGAGTTTAVVGTFHILPNSRLAGLANRILGLWLRPSLQRFDEVVSVSSAAASFAQKAYGLRTAVLPNVFDYEKFHRAEPLAVTPYDGKTILFLGRLVPRKGCKLLLEAVNVLARDSKVPNFRVLICGRGPLESVLKRYVTENNLSDRVSFKGFIDESDKPNYYAAADISVFPSSGGESFGIVLLEAMASGRAAVLAGNNPGYASVIGDRTELLFDPHDAPALAQKLKEYLLQDDLRRQVAEWGTAYTKQFDTALVASQLEAVYTKALRLRRNVR